MIGEQLKKYRKDIGATQEEFALKIGCTRQYYSGLEIGTETPSIKRLGEIAKSLGISVEYLLQGIQEPKSKERVISSSGKYLKNTRKGYICTAEFCSWKVNCGDGIFYCPCQGCMKEWQEQRERRKK